MEKAKDYELKYRDIEKQLQSGRGEMTKAYLLHKVNSYTAFSQYFEKGQRIGAGAFAEIEEVVYKESGKVVAAMKSVNLWRGHIKIQEYQLQEVFFNSSSIPDFIVYL